jgi:hypothetical protein
MNSKERVVRQAEDYIKADREKLIKKEQVEYHAKIPFQVAVLLRDAMVQRREEEAGQIPGAFSHDAMRVMPSSPEVKLDASVARFATEVINEYDEIDVPLQGVEVDEINTALFPTLRPHMLADSMVSARLDSLVAMNEAFKVASGMERPSYIAGMKPYQS